MAFDFNLLLLDTSISGHAEKVSQNNIDEEITYYIDNNIGWNYLDRYYNSAGRWITLDDDIRTFSIGHSNHIKDEIRKLFKQIDELIDLDFKEMSHNNGSEIDIYCINYSSNMEEDAVGQAIPQDSNSGAWWELLWK